MLLIALKLGRLVSKMTYDELLIYCHSTELVYHQTPQSAEVYISCGSARYVTAVATYIFFYFETFVIFVI